MKSLLRNRNQRYSGKIGGVILWLGILSSVLGLNVPVQARFFWSQNQVPQKPKNDQIDNRELQKLADKVYQSGIKLFRTGAYWKATQELIVIIDYYPQFRQIDGVYYYVAESLSELELHQPAIRTYNWLILKYPDSEFAPRALLGLQKIAFRQSDYQKSLTYYYSILKKYSESAALDASRYYAGQSLYNLKKWDQAILLLKRIDAQSAFYDYALYTISQSMLKKKESVKRSTTCWNWYACRLSPVNAVKSLTMPV
ncbi:tetratricopeptide repeat protein [candidate division KSB1 bacterium]|nr:tetratricopeptide repeat protein [candidate division KSB1 bacterium]